MLCRALGCRVRRGSVCTPAAPLRAGHIPSKPARTSSFLWDCFQPVQKPSKSMDIIFHGWFALPQVLTYRSSPRRLGRFGCKQQPQFKCIPFVTAKNGNPRVRVYVCACTCVRVRVRECVILGSVSCKYKEQSQKREYHAQFSILLFSCTVRCYFCVLVSHR